MPPNWRRERTLAGLMCSIGGREAVNSGWSIGFKTNIRLSNTTGVIDSDYYNNPDNEGHMWIKFYNPTDEDYHIFIGDKIAQGIFTKFLVTDDDNADQDRTGGLGSTGK